MTIRTITPDILPVPVDSVLGESPWWDGTHLSWVDIHKGVIHRCALDGSDFTSICTPGTPGFAIPTTTGSWAVGLQDGLWEATSDGSTWKQLWAAPHDARSHRMNDAKTDSRGRLWMGSMTYEEKDPVSTLYRWTVEGADPVVPEIITSNGLGWSPDDRTLYHTDSITRTIWAFDYDIDNGQLSNRQVFTVDPDDCVPDGMAVDAEGFIWSCKWNGYRIVRYAPDGGVDMVLELPVARPTSIDFVGPDRSVMAVTSARPGDFSTHGPLDGQVLLIPTKTHARLLHPVRLR